MHIPVSRIFEVGEVVRATEEDSTQHLRLAIGEMSPKSDYARIRSVTDAVFRELGLTIEVTPLTDHELAPVFLPGRAAAITLIGEMAGVMGEVAPEVITAWSLDHPVVVAELDADVLLANLI